MSVTVWPVSAPYLPAGAPGADPGRVEIAAFGRLQIFRGGRPVPLGPPKQQLVLTVLLIKLDVEVASAALVDAVWGDDPPASAADNLRLYISRLRRMLGPGVIAGRGKPGYRLVGDRVTTDLRRFRALQAAAQVLLADGQAGGARPLLVEAALLRRDRPFAGLPRTAVLEVHSRSVEELWLLATEQRLQIDLDRGAGEELADELSALVGRHPYRERLVGMAVVALTRSGRHRDAARLYRRTAAMLLRELGVEPSRELQTLRRTLIASE